MKKKRIGIVGYGNLGKYLSEEIRKRNDCEVAFVWNRTTQVLEGKIPERLICRDIHEFSTFDPDLIVEVCHPSISQKYGEMFLSRCDYFVGSPTALAAQEVEEALRKAASSYGIYVPAGAFWGGEDIKRMADLENLKSLKVTMKKHPSCFKLESPLKEINENVGDAPVVLHEGPVRSLCPLAPNNVNTMAAAAIAAHNLGFDGVRGCLVADRSLSDWHIVEVELTGPEVNGLPFTVHTTRRNPANRGVVTGSATYGAFLSSVVGAGGRGPGVHLC